MVFRIRDGILKFAESAGDAAAVRFPQSFLCRFPKGFYGACECLSVRTVALLKAALGSILMGFFRSVSADGSGNGSDALAKLTEAACSAGTLVCADGLIRFCLKFFYGMDKTVCTVSGTALLTGGRAAGSPAAAIGYGFTGYGRDGAVNGVFQRLKLCKDAADVDIGRNSL